eukprot:6207570-Pleurochrysis_carterae.AAC.1
MRKGGALERGRRCSQAQWEWQDVRGGGSAEQRCRHRRRHRLHGMRRQSFVTRSSRHHSVLRSSFIVISLSGNTSSFDISYPSSCPINTALPS